MKNEKIYSFFGAVLVCSALALIGLSVYWTFHGLTEISRLFVQEQNVSLVTLLGIGVLVMILLRSRPVALLLLLFIAGFDRLYFAGSYQIANSIAGGLCLLIATLILIGVTSEYWKFANKALPSVLMIFMFIFFMAPAWLAAKVLAAMRITPMKSDDDH